MGWLTPRAPCRQRGPAWEDRIIVEKTGFWSRVGHWIQGTDPDGLEPRFQAGESPSKHPHGRLDGRPPAKSRHAPNGTAHRLWSRLGGASVRADQLEQLSTKFVELTESIGTHLERQSLCSEEMARSLSQLNDGVEELSTTIRSQQALLEQVAARIQDQAACTARIEQTLAPLTPRIQEHRDTMVSIARHLESSRQTNEKGAATMEQFQRTLTTLVEGVQSSAGALNDLRTDAIERQESLSAGVERQSRRLTWFAATAVALLAIGAAAGWVAVFR